MCLHFLLLLLLQQQQLLLLLLILQPSAAASIYVGAGFKASSLPCRKSQRHDKPAKFAKTAKNSH
jgi:hypothetical protein